MRRFVLLAACTLVLVPMVTVSVDDLNPVTFRKAPKHDPVKLVIAGQAVGQIVRPAEQGRMLGAAIRDLQTFIREATGAELPIVNEADPAKPAIAVGDRSQSLTRSAERTSGVKSGLRLYREWNGKTHVVEIRDDAVHWNGGRYRSLSAVARAITGARWSGPRFFGLKSAGSS